MAQQRAQRWKRVIGALAGLSSLVTGVVVVTTAAPASAEVLVTSSGGELDVTVVTSGFDPAEPVGFSCSGGSVRVNDIAATPDLRCDQMTSVRVTSMGQVDISGLHHPSFPLHPVADVRGEGNGIVMLHLPASDDTVLAASAGPSITMQVEVGGSGVTHTLTGVITIWLDGGDGDDTINADGVLAGQTTATMVLAGGGGRNLLSSRSVGGVFYATHPLFWGPPVQGSAVIFGSPGADNITSSSPNDAIYTFGGPDAVIDPGISPRSGGRYIDSAGTVHHVTALGQDAFFRVRPTSVGGAKVVASLVRPGLQNLPPIVSQMHGDVSGDVAGGGRSVSDIELSSSFVSIDGTRNDRGPGDVLDVTVPRGTWQVVGNPPYRITTSDPGLGDIFLDHMDTISVHGPLHGTAAWVHRVHRDLLMDILPNEDRDMVGMRIDRGSTTHAKVVAGLVDSDEYLGLSVDRTYRKLLGRNPEPKERAVWISRLRNGEGMRALRTHLAASTGYFQAAGGTNRDFVAELYLDAMGRHGSDAGIAIWTQELAGGASRAEVAEAFLSSGEARELVILDQHLRLLNRIPTALERQQWSAILAADPDGEDAMIAALARSAEYRNLT